MQTQQSLTERMFAKMNAAAETKQGKPCFGCSLPLAINWIPIEADIDTSTGMQNDETSFCLMLNRLDMRSWGSGRRHHL